MDIMFIEPQECKGPIKSKVKYNIFSTPTKLGGDMGMVSVLAVSLTVYPWFLTNTFGLFNFGLRWFNFSPLLAENVWGWLKFIVFDNQENLLLDYLQTWNLHLFDESPEVIQFWNTLAQFPLSVAKNELKMVVFDHYLENW